MQNGNAICDGGAILDALALAQETTIEALLERVNAAFERAGLDPVSRITFWRWRTGARLPSLEESTIIEDELGISGRAWGRKAGAGDAAQEAS